MLMKQKNIQIYQLSKLNFMNIYFLIRFYFLYRQAVIAPSALSLVYPKATIEGYSREQFLNDLMSEAETDIRGCFASGAHSVQLDFTEARFSMKIDPTGGLLREFVRINNRVLNRFEPSLRERIGVHVCAGRVFFYKIR